MAVPGPQLGGDVDSAIAAAKSAAAKAGFDGPSEKLTGGRRKTSYGFAISPLNDAPQADELERHLEGIPGVSAQVIYTTNMVWITAPEALPLEQLVAAFAECGVAAELTDSSWRRRMLSLERAAGGASAESARGLNRRRRTTSSRRARRQSAAQERDLERLRRAGFLKHDPQDVVPVGKDYRELTPQPGSHSSSRDVLYTARDLITTPRLLVALVLTLPVLAMSYFLPLQFPGWQWLCLVLSLPVVSWSAWPFHRALVGGVRRGATALDGASSIAIALAFFWSAGVLVFSSAGEIGWKSVTTLLSIYQGGPEPVEIYLDVACWITLLLLGGRKLSIQTRTSLPDDLAAERPNPHDEVIRVQRNRATGRVIEERTTVGEINVGDDLIIPPGQRIPVDGIVLGGTSEIDPSIVGVVSGRERGRTQVKTEDYVFAGSLNLSKRLKIRVVRTGHRTRMAVVQRWTIELNRRQNRAVMTSTRSASYLIPAAGVLAIIGFGTWLALSANPAMAFGVALAVLTCVAPPALALSSALPMRLGMEAAARHGMLLRDGKVLRRLELVDAVVFNRVGTLAESDMTVETITAAPGENSELVLRVAGALSLESNHPVSKAIVHAARQARDNDTGDDLPHWVDVSNFTIGPDGSFSATIELPVEDSSGEKHIRQVPAKLWRPQTLSELRGPLGAAAVSGGTPLMVQWNGKDRGVITLHDTVKADAIAAVDRLEELGVETMMLSRDTYPVARRFGDRIGISQVLAGIAPGRKAYTVRSVHNSGRVVAAVGDSSVLGVLQVADVGILVPGDTPLEAIKPTEKVGVDVIVLRQDVSAIPDMIGLSQRVGKTIGRNLLFSWAYTALAVVVSLAGLMHPMVATVAMLTASLVIELGSNTVSKALRSHSRVGRG